MKRNTLGYLQSLFGANVIEYQFKLISGVYFHVKNHEVVYVGKSVNLYQRQSEWSPRTYDKIFYIPAPIEQLKQLEQEIITILRPSRNLQMIRDGKCTRKFIGPMQANIACENMGHPGS